MTLSRWTRERIYKDERLFNELLPFVKWDGPNRVFLHSDASLWSIWELSPLLLTSASNATAFQSCANIQSFLDSLNHRIKVQFSWITTFDVDDLLNDCITSYPLQGPSGWMARRWVRMIKNASKQNSSGARVKKLRLIAAFRYDPPWQGQELVERIKRQFLTLLGNTGMEIALDARMKEYQTYLQEFQGEVDGKIARLADMGFQPQMVDGQGIINILYPLLNRAQTKGGKFKKGRLNAVPIPKYDDDEILANQLSETPAYHPEDGYVVKDGRVYHAISMVKPPKRCLPLMTIPIQNVPYESIFTVTYSKEPKDKQLNRLSIRDTLLGLRARGPRGRSNQEVNHDISVIRAARDELYTGSSQIVKVGCHHVQITQNIDEARRANSEMLAVFPTMNDARGLSHLISDLGVIVNSLPGCYDASTDGPGWTCMIQSSRAVRLFPLWGNWKGSRNHQIILPSLWGRELVGFDLYDSNTAPNVVITGVSGAGKSYLLNFILITMNRGHYSVKTDGSRVARPPITFIFDKGMPNQPCGFERIAKLFGGQIYQATPSKAPAMNFLARIGEFDQDKTNEDFKDLLDIAVDVIVDMASEKDKKLGRLERNEVVESVLEAHYRYRHGVMDREFLLRDVVRVLKEPPRAGETEDNFRMRQQLAIMMREYYGDGTYARFFDRAGALKLKERFIVFDLKGLSRNPDLQRVFLKVAMLWADEVMNTSEELDTRKILVFDEAHDLIGKTAAGVVESAFRLYRKRKGIVIAASQSGEDFYVGEGGQAIIQNSSHKIFLKQDPSRFHLTAQAFGLTQQHANTIMALNTVKGVESQFFLLSDIGEAALVLPLEPSFYWVSTNNGDDNQLFSALLDENDGDFFLTLQRAVELAPMGAEALARKRKILEKMIEDANA